VIRTKKFTSKISIYFLLSFSILARSQSTQIPVDTKLEQKLFRLISLHGDEEQQLSDLRGIDRKSAFDLVTKLSISKPWSKLEKQELQYVIDGLSEFGYKIDQDEALSSGISIIKENILDQVFSTNKRPLFNKFYKTPHHLLSLHSNDYTLLLNPVLNISIGRESINKETIISNTRGVNLRGLLGDKIFFETELLENQESYPQYVDDFINRYNSIPRIGWYKGFKSRILNDFEGYDFFRATGYIGANLTKNISLQMGHGTNFIGQGIRSLILSDFSPNNFYVKVNTRFWKIDYQNLFSEVAATSKRGGDSLISKKYIVNHTLGFQLSKKLRIGLFETIIFNRQNQYELQYLNPMIFYRAVEHSLGSPDNVILGATASFVLKRGINMYGQLILDEFLLSEIRARRGWWGNKYGIQLGARYFRAFGIDGLDINIEANVMRPFTYSHSQGKASFSNYYLSMAHPLGANFKELISRVNYSITPKLTIAGQFFATQYGDDFDRSGRSYGGDINRDYQKREGEYGNIIGQGNKKNIRSIHLDGSYEFFPNYQIFGQLLYRTNTLKVKEDTRLVTTGVRINFGPRFSDY
jgi:hypothetical protein